MQNTPVLKLWHWAKNKIHTKNGGGGNEKKNQTKLHPFKIGSSVFWCYG